MAVSANDNGIKILANSDGVRLLRTFENLSYDAPRASESVAKVALSMISCECDIALSAIKSNLIVAFLCSLLLIQSQLQQLQLAVDLQTGVPLWLLLLEWFVGLSCSFRVASEFYTLVTCISIILRSHNSYYCHIVSVVC